MCLADRGPLVLVEDGVIQVFYNPRLRRAYRIEDGIPVLLVDEAQRGRRGRAYLPFGEVVRSSPVR